MNKVVAITQARTGSSRLPEKVLKKVNNQTLLEIHLNRIKKSRLISDLIVATTVAAADDAIVKLANNLNVRYSRGSEENVLDRFFQAAKDLQPDYVVRLTSDCPLIDSDLIDKVIKYTIENNIDYCSNTINPTYPDGQDIEVFKFSALEKAWKEATLKSDLEHVTPFIWRNSSFNNGALFKSHSFEEGFDYAEIRMTVDELNDFTLIKELIEKKGIDSNWADYVEFLIANPKILAINSNFKRNEGFFKSLEKD